MYADHFFRTRGNSACSHLALGGSGPPCTENAFGLHSLGPQFCTYAEHFVRGSKTKMEPELHYMVAENSGSPGKKCALIRNKFLLCSDCGYHKLYLRVWGKGCRVYEAEVRRLKNIEI